MCAQVYCFASGAPVVVGAEGIIGSACLNIVERGLAAETKEGLVGTALRDSRDSRMIANIAFGERSRSAWISQRLGGLAVVFGVLTVHSPQ